MKGDLDPAGGVVNGFLLGLLFFAIVAALVLLL
jgi:hypothetical protein